MGAEMNLEQPFEARLSEPREEDEVAALDAASES